MWLSVTPLSPEDKARALREELAYHEHRLHVLEYPLIRAERFEALREELRILEGRVGVPVTPDSPTLRDGRGPPREALERVPHRVPWPAPIAVRSPRELARVVESVRARDGSVGFVGGARLAGASVALSYASGLLVRAVLRGDGREGDDVTATVRTIGSVPLSLRPPGTITESRVTRLTKQALGPSTMTPVPPFPDELVVRGVVTAPSTVLAGLDRARVDAGAAPYVSAEAAVLASLRQLDASVARARGLRFFAEGVARTPSGIDGAWQLMGALKSWGFRVVPLAWRSTSYEELLDFVGELQRVRPHVEYLVRGGMLAPLRIVELDDDTPRELDLVFAPPTRPARVRATYRAVGRTGWLQPVALLDRPTPEAATVPEGAPIPALDGTHLLHVEPGDLVRVAMGPVAPELLADAPRAGAPAASCPACGAQVVRRADEPFERCADDGCRGRVRARVAHVIGSRGLALTSVPARALEALLAATQPLVELFELTEARVERVAPGLGAALVAERARRHRLALWRVLSLSHIHDVGERAARAAASAFESAEQLLASPERVLEVSSLSTAEARAVIAWARGEGRSILARLLAAGVEIVGEPEAFASPFAGKRVALAGQLERIAHDLFVDELERRGATIDARVSRLTDLVVAGRDGEAELAAAEAYDVLVVDEVALLGALRLSST